MMRREKPKKGKASSVPKDETGDLALAISDLHHTFSESKAERKRRRYMGVEEDIKKTIRLEQAMKAMKRHKTMWDSMSVTCQEQFKSVFVEKEKIMVKEYLDLLPS